MADILATASGNFSDPATWFGGVVPGAGDNAYANNRTVTIDTNITVSKVSNKPEAGAIFGGKFVISTSRTINGNVDGGGGGTSSLEISTPSPGVVTINGNAQGLSLETGFTGTLNVVGNITPNTVSQSYGLWSKSGSSGTVNVTGNVSSTSSSNRYGVYFQGSPTLNITGNLSCTGSTCLYSEATSNPNVTVVGTTHTVNSDYLLDLYRGTYSVTGSLAINSVSTWGRTFNDTSLTLNLTGTTWTVTYSGGLELYASSSLVLNGDIVGPNLASSGSYYYLARVMSGATSTSITINGNITANDAYGYIVNSAGSSNITINGNIVGNNTYNLPTVYITAANNTVTVNGTIFGANKSATVETTVDFTTVRCDKIVGNTFGFGAPVTVENRKTVVTPNTATSAKVITKQIQYGLRGNPPTTCPTFIDQDPSNSITMELEDDTTSVTFVPGIVSQDYPTPSEVLNGVSYGFGAFTGTLIQYNVVDTATLITEMKAEGIATVESVGDQVAFFGT